MPQHNDLPPDTLPGNEPILTDAERELLAEVDAPPEAQKPDDTPPDAGEGNPPAAAATEPPNPETPPPPGGVSASEPAAAQIDPLPSLHNEARDFAAERQAIDQKYSEQLATLKKQYQEDGLIDDDKYEAERERLIDARATEREALNVDRVKWETRAELTEEFAQHTWQQNVRTFLAAPENAILSRSPEIQQLWQATMQRAVDESAVAGTPLKTDAAIMEAGRNLLFQQLGLSAPASPPPVPPPADPKPPARVPKLDNLPPSIGALPGAAPNGAAMTGDELTGLDINDLERQMAGMSDAQLEALLRATPGAFVD